MKFFWWISIVITVGLQLPVKADPADTLQVKDLEEDWMMLREDYGLVPILDKKEFSGDVIHLPIDLDRYKNTLLNISADGRISLFIRDKLIDLLDGNKWYRIDSLREVYGDSVIMTFYQHHLDPYRLHTVLYREVDAALLRQMQAEQVIITPRKINALSDVLIVCLLIIAVYAAAVYAYYPRTMREFFQASRAFSLREVDENLMKTRPLSRVNLLFYLLLSMMGAWILVGLVQLSGMHLRQQLFQFDGFIGGLLVWVRLTLILGGFIFLKYVLVRTFKSLFSIPGFLNNHFYNYVRIGLLLYLAIIAGMLLTYFAIHVVSEAFYFNVLYLLAGLYFLRSLVIFFKLMNSSSYSILHLFSYLCATELVPLMLIIAFIKYQPI